MKAVIAIDSFKGCLSSLEAGDAVREGILRVYPDAQAEVRPLADGGEGTVEALTLGMGGTFWYADVTGPMGQKVRAAYGILHDGVTAVMEMSAAAAITMVPDEEKNPLLATTRGVGEMILDAAEKGCRNFIIGIGGSATNDGGIGMLQALGFSLLDKDGNQVAQGAQGLAQLVSISADNAAPELAGCRFRIACDVTNPLCGEQGCSAVFGPQKGADADMILQMDRWLAGYASLAKTVNDAADPDFPGSGAAGGIGFAFRTFLDAELQSGAEIVLEETKLEEYIKDADIVVTGEGRLDGQTVMGKAPVRVAGIGKKHGKKVIAFAGSAAEDAAVCNQHGIDAFFPILRRPATLREAMDPANARRNLTDTAEQVFRLI